MLSLSFEPIFSYFYLGWRFTLVLCVFLFLIFIHEFGHYFIGRLCGIGAESFSVGFGPTLFSFQDRQQTTWRIALFPLGGFVKFRGMQEIEVVGSEEKKYQKGDFLAQPLWRRALTVFAGPFFNFLFGFIFFTFLFFLRGQPVLPAVVGKIIPNSPAVAMLQINDRILRVNGQAVQKFQDIERLIQTASTDKISLVIDRHGEKKTILLQARPLESPKYSGLNYNVKMIGIMPQLASEYSFIHYPTMWESMQLSFGMIIDLVQKTGHFIVKTVSWSGDRCEVGGPVKIVSTVWDASGHDFLFLLVVGGFLSISLGIMNLLPFYPLDGGHLLLYFLKAILPQFIYERINWVIIRFGLVVFLIIIMLVVINDFFPCSG